MNDFKLIKILDKYESCYDNSYTRMEFLPLYLDCGQSIADVELGPSDVIDKASDIDSKTQWTADKIIIKNVRPIASLAEWNDEEWLLKNLKYAKKQFFLYMKNKSEKVQLASVKMYMNVLKFFEEKTYESVILKAIDSYSAYLNYLDKQKYKLCLFVARRSGAVLKYESVIKQYNNAIKNTKDKAFLEMAERNFRKDSYLQGKVTYDKKEMPSYFMCIAKLEGIKSRRVAKIFYQILSDGERHIIDCLFA